MPSDAYHVHRGQLGRALERGREIDLDGWAVYLAGEEIRCPCEYLYHGALQPCAGFLGQVGPGTAVHVRPFEERRFTERRREPRFRQPCEKCGGKVESHTREAEGVA